MPGVTPSVSLAPELLDLQVDYWSAPLTKADTGDRAEKLVKKDSKNSLKTAFRSVLVYRLPPLTSELPLSTLSMVMITREKKQKSTLHVSCDYFMTVFHFHLCGGGGRCSCISFLCNEIIVFLFLVDLTTYKYVNVCKP